MVENHGSSADAKLAELQRQIKLYLSEIKERIEEIPHPSMSMLSYFTYSLNLSHDPEQKSLCLGSFHITNMSNQVITNPYICIKIPEESPFTFTGKYVYKNFSQTLRTPGGWERINENENEEEFWLKPLGKQSIQPNETISFSDFQIEWTPTQSYGGSIMGYAYSDQKKEGLAVLNPINLSGNVDVQGDTDA